VKNLLFVDDEPRVLRGLQRQLGVVRDQWNMSFVESGRQALNFLRANPVDVVVTDMIMPGMDGAELLGEISKCYPNVVRIVLSGHTEHEAVLRLIGPAHQYLSKPCDAEMLRDAITRAMSLRDLLHNERLKELAARVKSLPSLPALYQQLTKELKNENASLERVGDIISHDIGMSAKILQLVNSAFFGLPQALKHPSDAVMYLGLATVSSLVLTVHVFSQYDQRTCTAFSLDEMAAHSWMTGEAARQVARCEGKEANVLDQCFLAGLLHDVGSLILATGLPNEYQEILQAAKSAGWPTCQMEQERFGASHADLGAYLLGLWGLPTPIIEAVALHHRPSCCASQVFSPVIAVHVADVFMHARSGASTEQPLPKLDAEFLTRIGLGNRIEVWRQLCLDGVGHPTCP
jgi:HD-like signal output (HDOD) protein